MSENLSAKERSHIYKKVLLVKVKFYWYNIHLRNCLHEMILKQLQDVFKLFMKQSQFKTDASVWPTKSNESISNKTGHF